MIIEFLVTWLFLSGQLLPHSLRMKTQGPVQAALAASLGSAALRAWEHVVFSEDTERGSTRRLFGGDAHEVLLGDLNRLRAFMYALTGRKRKARTAVT